MGVAGGGQIHLQRSRSNLTMPSVGLHLKSFLWKNERLFFLAFYVVREKECRNLNHF